MATRPLILALALGSVLGSAARADESSELVAMKVMLKVLTYDGTFAQRGSGDFVVLVPFSDDKKAKAEALVAQSAELSLRTINNRPLKFTAVPVGGLEAAKGSAVMLFPGSSPEVIKAALQFAAKAKLYSLAFDEAVVRDGAMLGVSTANGKPQVLLNAATAKGIGAELAPTVLRVARMVQ